ncbi:MAG: AarF/ABC1/UbiB kinase family protein [Micropruina sp.]|nr:AarF/ABC1/UbiB kinase family protein [Micropruina sp.]
MTYTGEEPDRQTSALPTGSLARSARLMSLPLSAAGRSAVGLGRRILGGDPEEIAAQARVQAAEQMFQVLGQLKGGAMKFGQMLSLFQAVLPDEIAQPFREQLSKLQDSAPPMPASRVQAVLLHELGPNWRSLFTSLDLRPAAAASIGQVHRGILAATGQSVAVKVQYPGADQALRSDLRQIERLAATISPLAGGVDVVALTREIAARISEEVDYSLEARNQQRAAEAFAGHDSFFVPTVRDATGRVLITDWVDGTKLSAVSQWSAEERNRVGLQYVRFLFAGPKVAGILHADPHPGNYLVMPDGRLAVVDFGLVARLPDGLPSAMGRLISLARDGRAEDMLAGMAEERFITSPVDAQELLDYLSPFVEPASVEEFHFTREWMRGEFQRVKSSAGRDAVAMQMNIPPVYALIYRVWMSGIAVLAQLDVRARFGDVLAEFLPGWRARS